MIFLMVRVDSSRLMRYWIKNWTSCGSCWMIIIANKTIKWSWFILPIPKNSQLHINNMVLGLPTQPFPIWFGLVHPLTRLLCAAKNSWVQKPSSLWFDSPGSVPIYRHGASKTARCFFGVGWVGSSLALKKDDFREKLVEFAQQPGSTWYFQTFLVFKEIPIWGRFSDPIWRPIFFNRKLCSSNVLWICAFHVHFFHLHFQWHLYTSLPVIFSSLGIIFIFTFHFLWADVFRFITLRPRDDFSFLLWILLDV